MSNVEFEADNTNYKHPGYSSNQSGSTSKGMIGWLVAHGIVRTENMGQTILIAIVAINFLASFIILKYFGVI